METKIIKAVFGGGTSTVTNKRTRTDYGQVLEIIGIDLPDTFECIFSNSNTSAGVGKKMIGSSQRVLIPDEYLATGQTIYAWVLVHDSEDDGRHMYSIRIPVADMPDTSPEEPTPVEQSVISQAIAALNSALDTTTQKAQEASESADRAEHAAEGVEGYAERAEAAQSASESARDIALEAKVSAQTSAATASEKASEAISSATTASQSALTAENASESAGASATASAESASQASQSADTASESASASAENALFTAGKALDASNSASEAAQSASTAVQAKTDAESAKTASETAQGLAESARDEAVTAKNDAESARDEAQSIVDGITGKVEQINSNTERIESLEDDRYKPYPTDASSGSIASFADGADDIPLKSCIVRVEPVQDLHGYDSPWPAGGGKNLFQTTAVTTTVNGVTFTVNSDGSIKTTGTPTANISTFIFGRQTLPSGEYIANGFANGANSETRMAVFNENTGAVVAIIYKGNGVTFTLTEESVIRVYPIILTDSYESGWTFYPMIRKATEADATFAPYSNECPITGWTGCEVQRTGINVWDEEWEIGGISSVDGSKYRDVNRIRSKNFIPVKPSTPYYFKMPSTFSAFKVAFYGVNKAFLSFRVFKNDIITTPPNCYWLMLSENTTDYGTTYNHDISINYPSTDHDYHPYTGHTYPITFPTEAGTVYGGYADVVNGELAVDRAIVDLGTLNWTINGRRFLVMLNGAVPSANDSTVANIVCSCYNAVTNNQTYGGTAVGISLNKDSDPYLGVYDPSYTDLASFKSAINGQQLCYELANPIHYPLEAIDIKTLLGQNNVWSNTGDTEVEYRADVKLYITKKIAEAISALS